MELRNQEEIAVKICFRFFEVKTQESSHTLISAEKNLLMKYKGCQPQPLL